MLDNYSRTGSDGFPVKLPLGACSPLFSMLVSHYVKMAENSYLLLGITWLTTTGLAFAPLVMVLLARISRLLGTGRQRDVNEYVGYLRTAVWQVSIVLGGVRPRFSPDRWCYGGWGHLACRPFR